jgi:mycobactin lysine-N-oxygenase
VPEAVTVVDYDHARKAWTIFTTGNKRYPVWFDGVVVTGSGPPLPSLPGANARVFDGLTFWQNLPAVSALLDQEHPEDQSVAIIGGGGTSAAVALWFSRTGIKKIPVNIIGREATLYARVPSYFEDRLFSDNSEWKTLAPHAQDAFLGRLAQGVVWNTVLQGLHKSENLTYRSFSARGFRMDSVSANPPGLILELDYPGPAGASPGSPVELQPATVFVDARGFNNWWFVDLLVPRGPLRQFFSQTTRTSVMNNIDDALAIRGDLPSGGRFPPGLHVPMIASRQGPGAPNLMALGWMSDQILVPHTSP